MVYTTKDDSLILTDLHKGRNVSKNCELFQHIPNLAELPYVRYVLRSKVSMSATTSRLLQYSKYDPMLMPKILLLTRVILESFKKEKGRFFMPTFCHIFYVLVMILYTLPCFFWHNLLQRQEFGVLQLIPHVLGQKVKFTIHCYYSSVTIHCYYSLSTIHLLLFTLNFCLFKGGCPLYFKQVLSVLCLGLLP